MLFDPHIRSSPALVPPPGVNLRLRYAAIEDRGNLAHLGARQEIRGCGQELEQILPVRDCHMITSASLKLYEGSASS